ncbi:hypothetical protein KJI95_06365 [Shewanella sp. JM162201]|uniref:Uncharacterized protein n=1 Tax=Shewanella jiangmenensis TaxID=2837387 RepID=A0ABS5V520_9GAMM|nr:hypothetical protein [Shewanella jiangmenensis]MBT1444148.1 hypothetical protein [Shewanella jiangmenensis]
MMDKLSHHKEKLTERAEKRIERETQPAQHETKLAQHEAKLPMDAAKFILSLSLLLALYLLKPEPVSAVVMVIWLSTLVYCVLSFCTLGYRLVMLLRYTRQRG